ncbi:hypothetical protein BDV95DRAFT_562663 [Massariosphaeria phaeospora]|uniref:Uncharacterized protein n=1 Tax=Massariosphaeria phaeospora TaxID=100035 RepID=A0A7C8MDJ2_9PLEO|nr:hypothetical protein BDV95DRAFT_562663 [Massariosphaeria phaeospora]
MASPPPTPAGSRQAPRKQPVALAPSPFQLQSPRPSPRQRPNMEPASAVQLNLAAHAHTQLWLQQHVQQHRELVKARTDTPQDVNTSGASRAVPRKTPASDTASTAGGERKRKKVSHVHTPAEPPASTTPKKARQAAPSQRLESKLVLEKPSRLPSATAGHKRPRHAPKAEPTPKDEPHDTPSSRANLRSAHRRSTPKPQTDVPDDDGPRRRSRSSRPLTPAVRGSARPKRGRPSYALAAEDSHSDSDIAQTTEVVDTPASTTARKRRRIATPTPEPEPEPEPKTPPPEASRIPPGLEGFKTAVGDVDWAEYVKLIEDRADGKVEEGELDRKTRALFAMTLPEGLRKKTVGRIRSLVSKMVIAGRQLEANEKLLKEGAGATAARVT